MKGLIAIALALATTQAHADHPTVAECHATLEQWRPDLVVAAMDDGLDMLEIKLKALHRSDLIERINQLSSCTVIESEFRTRLEYANLSMDYQALSYRRYHDFLKRHGLTERFLAEEP